MSDIYIFRFLRSSPDLKESGLHLYKFESTTSPGIGGWTLMMPLLCSARSSHHSSVVLQLGLLLLIQFILMVVMLPSPLDAVTPITVSCSYGSSGYVSINLPPNGGALSIWTPYSGQVGERQAFANAVAIAEEPVYLVNFTFNVLNENGMGPTAIPAYGVVLDSSFSLVQKVDISSALATVPTTVGVFVSIPASFSSPPLLSGQQTYYLGFAFSANTSSETVEYGIEASDTDSAEYQCGQQPCNNPSLWYWGGAGSIQMNASFHCIQSTSLWTLSWLNVLVIED